MVGIKYIYAIVISLTFWVNGFSQVCDVKYFPRKGEIVFNCTGNDHTRFLLYVDTNKTQLVSIQNHYNEVTPFEKDFEYDSLIIYKAIVRHQRFRILLKYSPETDIQYSYGLDPADNHMTLLTIFDAAAL